VSDETHVLTLIVKLREIANELRDVLPEVALPLDKAARHMEKLLARIAELETSSPVCRGCGCALRLRPGETRDVCSQRCLEAVTAAEDR
jgi:hypothetical protein